MAKKRKPYVPEPRPAWAKPTRPVAGIFGPHRDFPITAKELATLQKRQQTLLLDAAQQIGPESATTRPNHPTERIMTSKEIIAQAIALLKMIAWLTPIKFDDFAARFLEANQEAAWLIALVERIIPASTPDELEAQSLLYEPDLVTALQLFNKREGKPPIAGSGKILALIIQVLALVKAGKGLIPTS